MFRLLYFGNVISGLWFWVRVRVIVRVIVGIRYWVRVLFFYVLRFVV